jgi:hypothetical protein
MKKLELQDEKILEKLKKKEKLAAENLDAIQ